MVLKPIETRYRGYRFRSRLEARWAVFFDALGVRWEYEKEGYELTEGRYLPDFWLPELNLWLEIKPTYPDWDSETLKKCRSLGYATNKPVGVAWGLPSMSPTAESGLLIMCGDIGDSSGGESTWTSVFALSRKDGGAVCVCCNSNSERSFYTTGETMEPWNGMKSLSDVFAVPARAVEAARAARFEYGESG